MRYEGGAGEGAGGECARAMQQLLLSNATALDFGLSSMSPSRAKKVKSAGEKERPSLREDFKLASQLVILASWPA